MEYQIFKYILFPITDKECKFLYKNPDICREYKERVALILGYWPISCVPEDVMSSKFPKIRVEMNEPICPPPVELRDSPVYKNSYDFSVLPIKSPFQMEDPDIFGGSLRKLIDDLNADSGFYSNLYYRAFEKKKYGIFFDDQFTGLFPDISKVLMDESDDLLKKIQLYSIEYNKNPSYFIDGLELIIREVRDNMGKPFWGVYENVETSLKIRSEIFNKIENLIHPKIGTTSEKELKDEYNRVLKAIDNALSLISSLRNSCAKNSANGEARQGEKKGLWIHNDMNILKDIDHNLYEKIYIKKQCEFTQAMQEGSTCNWKPDPITACALWARLSDNSYVEKSDSQYNWKNMERVFRFENRSFKDQFKNASAIGTFWGKKKDTKAGKAALKIINQEIIKI